MDVMREAASKLEMASRSRPCCPNQGCCCPWLRRRRRRRTLVVMRGDDVETAPPPPSAPLPQPRLLLSRGAREYTAKMLCTPLTSLWFVRYHFPWFPVVRHRPVIHIVLLRLSPIEPVFLFYAFCGHLMKG